MHFLQLASWGRDIPEACLDGIVCLAEPMTECTASCVNGFETSAGWCSFCVPQLMSRVWCACELLHSLQSHLSGSTKQSRLPHNRNTQVSMHQIMDGHGTLGDSHILCNSAEVLHELMRILQSGCCGSIIQRAWLRTRACQVKLVPRTRCITPCGD